MEGSFVGVLVLRKIIVFYFQSSFAGCLLDEVFEGFVVVVVVFVVVKNVARVLP